MENHIENQDELSSTTATPHQGILESKSENRLQVTTQQVTNSNQEERSTCWLLLPIFWNVLGLIVCINIVAAFLLMIQCHLKIGDASAGLILCFPLLIVLIFVLMDWLGTSNRSTASGDIIINPYKICFSFGFLIIFVSLVVAIFMSSWLLGSLVLALYIFRRILSSVLVRRIEYKIDRTIVTSPSKVPQENKTFLAITITVTCVASTLISYGPKLFALTLLSLASQQDDQVSWLDFSSLIFNLIALVFGVLGMILGHFARKSSKYPIQKIVCLIFGLLMVVMLPVTIFAEYTTWLVVHSIYLFSIFMLLGIMLTATIKLHTVFLTSRPAMIKCLFLVLFVAIGSILIVGVVSESLKVAFVNPDDTKLLCTTLKSSYKSATVENDLKALASATIIVQFCGLLVAVFLFYFGGVLLEIFHRFLVIPIRNCRVICNCCCSSVRNKAKSNSQKENQTELDEVAVEQPST